MPEIVEKAGLHAKLIINSCVSAVAEISSPAHADIDRLLQASDIGQQVRDVLCLQACLESFGHDRLAGTGHPLDLFTWDDRFFPIRLTEGEAGRGVAGDYAEQASAVGGVDEE